MSEKYDRGKSKSDSKEERISSGETELLEGMQREWYKLYENEPVKNDKGEIVEYPKWTYDDVLDNPRPFLDKMVEIKVIPAYRYVINYLLLRTELGVENDNQRRFAAFIAKGDVRDFPEEEEDWKGRCSQSLCCERGQNQKEFLEEDCQNLWQMLICRLDMLFQENGYNETIDWKEFFSGLLESFSFKSLKWLALGIHMPLEDFKIFLTRVLKRSYVNFYDRDEIFVYLALKYAEETGCGTYQAYKKLDGMYPSEELDKIDKKPEWEGKKDSVSTESLGKGLEEVLSDKRNSLFETTDAKLEEYLAYIAWQNKRLDNREISRTARKRFLELWNELKGKWQDNSEIVALMTHSEKENRRRDAEEQPFYKELTIEYNPETGCVLPAGTEFRTKTLMDTVQGNDVAVFRLPQEQILPAGTRFTGKIPVKALMSKEEYDKIKQVLLSVPGIRSVPQFVKDNLFIKLEKNNRNFSPMKVCSDQLRENITGIQTGGGVRFSEGENKNEGILLVECKESTVIPKGTEFCFKLEEIEFRYKSLEEVRCCPEGEDDAGGESHAVSKVQAVWENIEEFRREVVSNKCKFLDANAMFTYDPECENIYKVYAERGIELEPVDYWNEQQDVKVSNSLLFRQIYNTFEDRNADYAGYYQGFSEYGKDYFLNSKLFKESRIIRTHLTEPPADEERLRNLILTLKFLEYICWDDGEAHYEADELDILMNEFLIDYKTDQELMDCGFHTFSTRFAYDAFLMFLLNSDSPLELFQAIWSDKQLLWKENE